MNLRFWQSAKPETRSAYDEQLINALHQQALAPTPDLSSVAAALAAREIIARCLAAVHVMPDHPVLTPAWFACVGRDLAWTGRHISLIDLDGDGLLLAPATSFDVASGGQLRQSNWRYTVDISLPDKTLRKTVSAASVVDISFGPGLQAATLTAGTLAELEARIRDEAKNSTHGKLLSLAEADGQDEDDDPLAAVAVDMGKAQGKTIFVSPPSEHLNGLGVASAAPAPSVVRLRPEIDPPILDARRDAAAALGAMLAVLGPLLTGDGESGAWREAQRWLFSNYLTPLRATLEVELSDKLSTPIALSFQNLRLDNLRERASAAKALTDAGLDQAQALALAGLG